MTSLPSCLAAVTKDCERSDCRIVESGGAMTAAYYEPVYDREGNNLNPDRNTVSLTLRCLTCGRTKDVEHRNNA